MKLIYARQRERAIVLRTIGATAMFILSGFTDQFSFWWKVCLSIAVLLTMAAIYSWQQALMAIRQVEEEEASSDDSKNNDNDSNRTPPSNSITNRRDEIRHQIDELQKSLDELRKKK